MSRVFDERPKTARCPICGTADEGRCVLAGVDGTERGRNEEAVVVHLACVLDGLRYNRAADVVYVGRRE